MLQRLRSLLARIGGKFAPRPLTRIILDEVGFRLYPLGREGGTVRHFKWQEITTLVSYKRDLFGYDLICLAVEDARGVSEISEGDGGWDEFIRAAEENLPGSAPVKTWWPAVASPAFASQSRTIYRKEESPDCSASRPPAVRAD
jgi:hypothetical protein